MRMRTRGGGIAALLLLALVPPVQADERVAANLADLSLEQLANVVVTSVSRRNEKLSEAAASIYVITADDIRRSGANTLPQALRLAPNLQVARADANQWAISARGFNSVLTNKMLVLIDGRTVYSPLFSGTFWEVQDLLMADVERIEVVSGPGGTMWGTNAVNGVINVITKSAADTHGSLAGVGGGNTMWAGALRSGGGIGGAWHARGWFKAVLIDDSKRGDRTEVRDASDRDLVGVRFDRESGDNAWTIEAGGYDIDIEQLPLDRDLTGYHLLGRWSKQPEKGSTFNLQAYYDRTNREQPGSIIDKLDTYDIEFQHGFGMFAHQQILWGAGYRYQCDAVTNVGPALAFIPDDRPIRTAHVFAQDAIRLTDAWTLELGLKAESNEYTDVEWLPTVRLAVKPGARHLLWSSVSRAVRAPARIEKDFFTPAAPPHFVAGGPDFVSEVSDVAEVGYRGQPFADLSLSLTAYVHEHDELRSLEPTPAGGQWQNKIHGTTRGLEGWMRWRPHRTWELSAGGAVQDIRLALDADSQDLGGLATLGNDPDFWYGIRTSLDVTDDIEFSADFRRVGALPRPYVPAYNSADARIGWWMWPNVSLSVSGRNLLERSHPEWGVDPVRAEVLRSFFIGLGWRSR